MSLWNMTRLLLLKPVCYLTRNGNKADIEAETLGIVSLQKLQNLILVEKVAYKTGTFKPYKNHSRPQLKLHPSIAKFKNLSTLTLIIINEKFYAMFIERNGEIDAEGVWGKEDFLRYRKKISSLLTEHGEENKNWKVPALKLRTKGQFCAAKKLGYISWSKR